MNIYIIGSLHIRKILTLLVIFISQNIFSQTILFETKENGIPYRIPAITTLSNGSILCISDYRISKFDIGHGDIDLHGRISNDNGETWSNIFTIADGNGVIDSPLCGFGDASIASINNNILIMCVGGSTPFYMGDTINHNSMIQIKGKFNKKNKKIIFDKPTDVSKLFFETLFPKAHTMFIASGKITVGKHNRLYCSVLIKDDYDHIYKNYVIYSDDFGDSWNILGDNNPCIIGGDEAKVVELNNGQIIISSRKNGGGRLFNVFTYTNFKHGKGNWDKQCYNKFEGKNSTNGELLVYNDILLQSLPTKNDRRNVSIFYKVIYPNTKYTSQQIVKDWLFGLVIDKNLSAYSTMVILKDKTIGVLYEKNKETNNTYGSTDIIFIKYKITDIIKYNKSTKRNIK